MNKSIALLLLVFSCLVNAGDGSNLKKVQPVAERSFFPLPVGARWTYRCVNEGGEPAAGWSMSVLSEQVTPIGMRYVVSISRDSDQVVTKSSYLVRGDGKVFAEALEAAVPGVAMVPTAALSMKPGEHYLAGTSSGLVDYQLPSGRVIKAMKVEQGRSPDAGGDESWTASYFAVGFGLVGTANGLGGGCELLRFDKAASALKAKR